MSFQGKTAVITGASSGIGLLCAQCFAEQGANIVMMGAMAANSDLFTEDDLERLTNEFFEKKGKINPKNSLCFRAGTQIH